MLRQRWVAAALINPITCCSKMLLLSSFEPNSKVFHFSISQPLRTAIASPPNLVFSKLQSSIHYFYRTRSPGLLRTIFLLTHELGPPPWRSLLVDYGLGCSHWSQTVLSGTEQDSYSLFCLVSFYQGCYPGFHQLFQTRKTKGLVFLCQL